MDDLPAEHVYHLAIQQYAPGMPGQGAVTSAVWVQGLELQQAGVSLPANNPGPADILNGLYTIKNESFGGLAPPVTFAKGASSNQQSTPCYFIVQAKGGKWIAPNGSKYLCVS
jgi:branched-chain amino acid transport system substrate-binding protein